MAVTSLPGAPTTRLSFGRLAAINAFWFGGGAHWQPIYIALIPVGASIIAGPNADLLIGRVTAAGGVFALLTPILVGWLSDRTVTRWGRRRPWMVAGTVLNIIGLGLLALSASQLTFIAAYLLVQLSNNAAGAAYTGVIPDVVRAEDRGRASGLLGTMNQLGTVVGVGLVGLTFKLYGDTRAGLLAGYGIVALIMAITLLITVVAVKENPHPALPRERGREIEASGRVRVGVIICIAAFVGALIPSMIGGILSDRTGRRKLFVYISSAMQAVVVSVLLFGLIRSLTLLYVLGILYGIGYGAYYAVDWALACDVLPNREEAAGRDMALWHVSFTMLQVLAPALLAGFLHFLNEPGHQLLGVSSGHDLGFRFIFGSAALWFILGTVMVSRIRGVR